MDANFERFFLVIHGSIEKYITMAKRNGKQVSYSRVQAEMTGTIARIMSDFECQVFFTPDVSSASQFIVKLHDKLHKPASKHGAQSIRRVASNDLRLDMIMTVPGVGREVAERLLESCGSIEEMCFPESLKQIKGLGEVRRKLLIKILTSEEPVKQERKVRR
jgi:ERCC4-type nuclease